MAMAPFHRAFPGVAREETRSIIVPHECGVVPGGEYALVELYCIERGCDCRNVLLNVMDASGRHAATINHSLGERAEVQALLRRLR